MTDNTTRMIENVARAIWMTGQTFAQLDESGDTYDGLPDYAQDHYRDLARSAIAAMPGWEPISTAPFNTPVRIKAGSMTFIARLLPNAAMSDIDTYCDQWAAEFEGEHPPCWSGGSCWESNEDEMTSLQPTAWQPIDAALSDATTDREAG